MTDTIHCEECGTEIDRTEARVVSLSVGSVTLCATCADWIVTEGIPQRPRIVVVMEGGLVQSVNYDPARPVPAVDVLVIDYDAGETTDAENDPGVVDLPQPDSDEPSPAWANLRDLYPLDPAIAAKLREVFPGSSTTNKDGDA